MRMKYSNIRLCLLTSFTFAVFAAASAGQTGQFSDGQPSRHVAEDLNSQSASAADESPHQTSADVYARLEQPINLEYPIAISLKAFAADLEEKLGVTCHLERNGIGDVGLSIQDPFLSASLKGIPAKLALRTILPEYDLGYYVKGPLIVLTSSLRADSVMETRVYDVRDLLAADEQYVSQYKKQAADGCQIDNAGPIPAGASMQDSITQIGPETRLVVMIFETTERADLPRWFDNGGPGTMNIYSGILVVSQSTEVHEEIAELLSMLRELQ